MNTKATEKITQMFGHFGALFLLPPPDPEYITAMQTEMSGMGWRLSQLQDALEYLKGSKEYNENARFGRYPTIYEITDAAWQMRQ